MITGGNAHNRFNQYQFKVQLILIKGTKFRIYYIVVTKDWLVGDRAAMEIERRCGGRLGQASRLVYY